MARLPMNGADLDDAAAAAYLDALTDALADGKIVGDDAHQVAALAGAAGMGVTQVRSLNERFLEAMREAAYADDVHTRTELGDLTRAATALGVDGYFDDLSPTAGHLGATSARQPMTSPPGATAAVRRCGRCRTSGHYRNTCPELVTSP